MSQQEEQQITFSILVDLVKQRQNDEIKKIVATADSSELIDSSGTTLLHLAAKYNNVELIKFLLDSGYDSNLENSDGATPLSIAAINNHSDALKVLLDIDIDIPTDKWINLLKSIVVQSQQIQENVIGDILKFLRKKFSNTQEASDILTEAGLPLDLVLLMEDADVTKEMLVRNESLHSKDLRNLLVRAMKSGYNDNVKVLMLPENDDHDVEYPKLKVYIRTIRNMIKEPNADLNLAKMFVENIGNWQLFKKLWMLDILFDIFENQTKEVVEVFLDGGVNEYIKNEYNFDLIALILRNKKLKMHEILRGRKFNPNMIGSDNWSVLRQAIWFGTEEDVKFLLEHGADPNWTHESGCSIFYYFGLAKYAILFLKHGADVQIISNKGDTIFDVVRDSTEFYVAHLAMIEAQGTVVKQAIRDSINKNSELKKIYTSCFREIEWMKKLKIHGNISYFNALTSNARKLSSCIRSKEVIIVTLSCCLKRGIHSYYYDNLQLNLNKAFTMYNLKSNAAKVISECSQVVEPEHLVIDVILSFLTFEDLKMFA